MNTCENCHKAFEAGYEESEKAYIGTIEGLRARVAELTAALGVGDYSAMALTTMINRHGCARGAIPCRSCEIAALALRNAGWVVGEPSYDAGPGPWYNRRAPMEGQR